MTISTAKKGTLIHIKIDEIQYSIDSLDYVHLEKSIERLDNFDFESRRHSLSKNYIIEKLNYIKKKSKKNNHNNNTPLAEYFTK